MFLFYNKCFISCKNNDRPLFPRYAFPRATWERGNIGYHEEAHTYQYQQYGPFYLPAYMLNGGFSGPLNNHFEREAQDYGRR